MYSKILLILILAASLLRFLFLEISPPGFYIDEAMGAAHSLCYQQTGKDLFGHLGLFSKIDFGGFQSGPFLLAGALWTKVWGTGTSGFRSMMAMVGVLTLFGLYRLILGLIGDRSAALFGTLLASFLPWSFQFSRISWDAPLATAFMIWSLAVLVHRSSVKQWILSGVLMALASYTYAPMRIQAIILILFIPQFTIRARAWLLGTFFLLNLPVIPYYWNPEFTARSKMLAITSNYHGNPFYGHGPLQLFWDYLTQVASHFSPEFLLLHGDHNLRHSIQTFGMLDAVTFLGLCLAVVSLAIAIIKKNKFLPEYSSFLVLAAIGLFTGVTPAALTWESIPHAIRSLGAWPFLVMFATYGWMVFFSFLPQWRKWVVLTSVCCFVAYLHSYFDHYPKISSLWFDQSAVESIRSSGEFPSGYQKVAKAYYRMHLMNESCEKIQEEFQWHL